MNGARLLVAAILLSLVVLTWWLAERVTTPLDAGSPRTAERTPDYFVKGLRVTTMTEDGEPGRELRTPEMRHYLDDESTELSSPHITIFRSGLPPWEVTAERGWVSRDGELVVLSGAVRIERAGSADVPPMLLETEELRYSPADDYAETDTRVRIESLQDHVEALGMRAWLRKPARVELLSEARGRYVPR